MEPYRFQETASAGGLARALVLVIVATSLQAYCYAILFRDCPLVFGIWWGMIVLLFAGLLGKSLEKIVGWCGLQGKRVANCLAVLSLCLAGWIVWDLWLQRAESGIVWVQAALFPVVIYVCFYNFRWQKYGYCDACNQWLQPVQTLGPYRYNKGVLTQLQMREGLDLSFLEKAPVKSRKVCLLVLSCCPECQETKTLRVEKREYHPLGVDCGILGLFTVPSVRPPSDIGPSL